MAPATRELDLTEVLDTLEAWRRTAWVTTATGHDRYRAIMRDAEHRLRTGQRPPGAAHAFFCSNDQFGRRTGSTRA